MAFSQNLCRICGQISETCHCIYNSDFGNNLETKIKNCLQLKILRDDCKPKQICNSCLVKLNDFTEFINVSHSTNVKLDSIFASMKNNCLDIDIIPSRNVLVTSKETNTNLTDQIGQTANDRDEDYENKKFPAIDQDVQEKKRFYFNDDGVLTHVQNVQFDNKAIIEYSYVNNAHEQCPECVLEKRSKSMDDTAISPSKNLFFSNTEMCGNMSSMNLSKSMKPKERIYECLQCSRKFLRKSALNSHLAHSHALEKMEIKSITKTNMGPPKALLFGGKVKHKLVSKCNISDYECSICNMIFNTKTKLKQHEKWHCNELFYYCYLCPKKFKCKKSLTEHVKRHT